MDINRRKFDYKQHEKDYNYALQHALTHSLAKKRSSQFMLDLRDEREQMLSTANQELHEENERLKRQIKRQQIVMSGRKQQLKHIKSLVNACINVISNLEKALANAQKSHKKLSAVVRYTMSPDEWRERRKITAKIYPELFESED